MNTAELTKSFLGQDISHLQASVYVLLANDIETPGIIQQIWQLLLDEINLPREQKSNWEQISRITVGTILHCHDQRGDFLHLCQQNIFSAQTRSSLGKEKILGIILGLFKAISAIKVDAYQIKESSEGETVQLLDEAIINVITSPNIAAMDSAFELLQPKLGGFIRGGPTEREIKNAKTRQGLLNQAIRTAVSERLPEQLRISGAWRKSLRMIIPVAAKLTNESSAVLPIEQSPVPTKLGRYLAEQIINVIFLEPRLEEKLDILLTWYDASPSQTVK